MKNHNLTGMNDATDVYIRQSLKNWAAQQQPPENGRARLLLIASASATKIDRFVSRKDANKPLVPQPATHQPSFWAIESMNRTMDWPELRLRALRRGS